MGTSVSWLEGRGLSCIVVHWQAMAIEEESEGEERGRKRVGWVEGDQGKEKEGERGRCKREREMEGERTNCFTWLIGSSQTTLTGPTIL